MRRLLTKERDGLETERQTHDLHVDQDDPVVQEVPPLLVDPECDEGKDERGNVCNSFTHTRTHTYMYDFIIFFDPTMQLKHGP